MKLVTWNVNGIRAAGKKGFVPIVQRERPDILCLQETKAHPDQVPPDVREPDGMKGAWSSAKRKGYSGVATLVRDSIPVIEMQSQIGIEAYDDEGRVVVSDHGAFLLYNIYFPNGGSGDERHQFKQKFLNDLLLHLQAKLKSGREIIVVGDYNVAHRDIDVYDPVRLSAESGFLPEERKWMDDFLSLGFVDTFRHFFPNEKDRYTWWSQIERARPVNRGWRIDYICVSQGLVPKLKRADIREDIEGSDHCPVELEMDL